MQVITYKGGDCCHLQSCEKVTHIFRHGGLTIVRAIVNTRCEPLSTGNQHPQTDYLRKRLTILLHTNRSRYEPGREEHNVCDSDDSLTDEIKHLYPVSNKNNQCTDFIEHNTYISANDSSNNSYTTTATISHIRGPDLRKRILWPYNIPSCTQTRVHFTTLTH